MFGRALKTHMGLVYFNIQLRLYGRSKWQTARFNRQNILRRQNLSQILIQKASKGGQAISRQLAERFSLNQLKFFIRISFYLADRGRKLVENFILSSYFSFFFFVVYISSLIFLCIDTTTFYSL